MKNKVKWLKRPMHFGLALLLIAILTIGTTIAFFTDIEAAVNSITTGKIQIDINEKVDGLTKNDIGAVSYTHLGDAGLRQGRRDAEYNARRIENKHGEKGTFVIYVKYRQNATWQGEMLWLEGNLKISFRSVLELLKLIDSTFEIGNAETTLAHG